MVSLGPLRQPGARLRHDPLRGRDEDFVGRRRPNQRNSERATVKAGRRAPMRIDRISPIGDQAVGGGEDTQGVNRMPERASG
jgi:hypothetical protein